LFRFEQNQNLASPKTFDPTSVYLIFKFSTPTLNTLSISVLPNGILLII